MKHYKVNNPAHEEIREKKYVQYKVILMNLYKYTSKVFINNSYLSDTIRDRYVVPYSIR